MKPIKFKEANTEIAKNQEEYQTLPAKVKKDGEVICCWGLSFWERVKILFGENIYVSILTFKNPLQPLLPTVGFQEKEFTFWDIGENGEKTNERIVKESKLTEVEKESLEANDISFNKKVMDTTKEYILMCEKAHEIQKAKKTFIDADFYIDLNDDKEWKIFDCCENKENSTRKDSEIWLPRQDQLQELIRYDKSDLELANSFTRFQLNRYAKIEGITPPPGEVFRSLEQLWFGYVMKIKYNQYWDWPRDEWKEFEKHEIM